MTTDRDDDAHQHRPEHDDHEHAHHEHEFEPVDYVDAVEAFRAEKDHYFKHGDASPIPFRERPAFEGLPYFPVDADLRFEGLTLEPYAGGESRSFMIPTSDGRLRPANRAGTLHFEVGGTIRSLVGYVIGSGDDTPPEDDDAELEGGRAGPTLFVPFLDATSGRETYGAGRYLDIEPEDDGTYSLDFNLAYHPSCAYDPRFSCPLTPAENRLDIRIEAGERLPADVSD